MEKEKEPEYSEGRKKPYFFQSLFRFAIPPNYTYRFDVILTVHPVCGLLPGSSPQTGGITFSSTPYRQLENQSTKYHRQQPPV
jgi:hypothetical protein